MVGALVEVIAERGRRAGADVKREQISGEAMAGGRKRSERRAYGGYSA